jgi:prepilin-type N-terminal cleavage/methylation domain-containing protein
MLRTRAPGGGPRPGYTLIELLVVISIIAILAALTTAAVQRVRQMGRNATVRADIEQLTAAVENFKSKFRVDHLPSFGEVPQFNPANGAILNPGKFDPQFRFRFQDFYPAQASTNPQIADMGSFEAQYLKRLFPRLTVLTAPVGSLAPGLYTYQPLTDTAPPQAIPAPGNNIALDCNQVLVFFLSGGPITNYDGFSTDPRNPFARRATPDEKRMAGTPMFETFPRQADGPTDQWNPAGGQTVFPRYLDPWKTPYLYISSNGTKYYYYPNLPGPNPPGPAQNIFDIQPNRPFIQQDFLQNFLPNASAAAGTPGADNRWANFRPKYQDTVGNTGRVGVDALKTPRSNATTPGKFLMDKRFQIISAGPDQIFGRGADPQPSQMNPNTLDAYYRPGQGLYADNGPGGDDLANVGQFKLSAGDN